MYLLVNPNGSKYFRLKYRYGGKEKNLALGVYPDTSLKLAREKRDNAIELTPMAVTLAKPEKLKKWQSHTRLKA